MQRKKQAKTPRTNINPSSPEPIQNFKFCLTSKKQCFKKERQNETVKRFILRRTCYLQKAWKINHLHS